MASPGCSWCRVTSSGSSLSKPHCDSVNNCYWGITGLVLQDVNKQFWSSSTTDTPADDTGGLNVWRIVGIVIAGIIGLVTLCYIIYIVCKNKQIAVGAAPAVSRPPPPASEHRPPESQQPVTIPLEPSAPPREVAFDYSVPTNVYASAPSQDQPPPSYDILYPPLTNK